MLSGPFVRFVFPTRTACALGATTRYITRLSGNMQGYLASGTFNGFGLQSAGACPQHSPAAHSANGTSVDFIGSPLTLQVYLYHVGTGVSSRFAKAHTTAMGPSSL